MSSLDLKKKIIDMQNDSIYQNLSTSYNKQNIFSILKIERNENRHSAFLCWLFNPDSEHGLGLIPLKKLLALYALHNEALQPDLAMLMISGNYQLEVEDCTTERSLNQIAESRGKDRLDIWMKLWLTDCDGNKMMMPLVIENKIYSNEGQNQTKKYHDAVAQYLAKEKRAHAIEIYLTPDDTKTCSCEQFVHLTYQTLLDNVIEPLTAYPMSSEYSDLINAYIENLSVPATQWTDDKEIDPNKLSNSILAISSTHRKNLTDLYSRYKELYDAALFVAGGEATRKLMNDINVNSEYVELLQNFWDNNINLFTTILYVCKSQIVECHEGELMKVFKQNRRDNSKYRVLWDKNGDGNWTTIDGFEKPLSKGRTVAVFFMKWMELSSPKSIDEVRAAFPTKINSYYAHNKKKKQYDSVVCLSEDDKKAKTESGFEIEITKSCWDLYPIKQDAPYGPGYGTLYKNNKTAGKAMIAKMWRKGDFKNFLEHIKKQSNTLFKRLKIVPAY